MTIKILTSFDTINELVRRTACVAKSDRRSIDRKLDELRLVLGDGEPLPFKVKLLLDQINSTAEMAQLQIENLQYDIAELTGHELPEEEKEDMDRAET